MEIMMFKIKNSFGEEIELTPKFALYCVQDFVGKECYIPAIRLYVKKSGTFLPYATLTKSFGEFIGLKNSAYIDINNCPFAPQLLNMGFVKDTGFTRQSGYCTYPLWQFDEEFLRKIGGEEYELYNNEFNKYMNI